MKNKPIHHKGMIAILGILIIIPLFYIILINMGYVENNAFRFLKKPQKIVQISCGFRHIAALTSGGQVVSKGDRMDLIDALIDDSTKWKDIIAVTAGNNMTFGLKKDGTVAYSAITDLSQMQLNFNRSPDLSSWSNITMISASQYQVVGLRSDGTVVFEAGSSLNKAMGADEIKNWTDIAAVSAGSIHTVGLRKDGTVVATGRIGGLEVKVDGWTDIVAIAAGGSCTVGLMRDGTAVSTGSSFSGDQDISDWTDITAITAGGNIVAGLKKDGTIAIAPGAPTECKIITAGWTDIVAIAAGNCWLAALRADGTVLTTNTGMLDTDEYGVVRGGWAVDFGDSMPTQ